MTITVTASYGGFRRLAPKPAPPLNRPDEYWWVRLDEGMPLEPGCVSFKGDAPAKVQLIGDDSACGTPVEDYQWTHTDEDGVTTVHTRLELIERILPPGRLAVVIPILEDVLSQQTAPTPDQHLFEAIALLKAGA